MSSAPTSAPLEGTGRGQRPWVPMGLCVTTAGGARRGTGRCCGRGFGLQAPCGEIRTTGSTLPPPPPPASWGQCRFSLPRYNISFHPFGSSGPGRVLAEEVQGPHLPRPQAHSGEAASPHAQRRTGRTHFGTPGTRSPSEVKSLQNSGASNAERPLITHHPAPGSERLSPHPGEN